MNDLVYLMKNCNISTYADNTQIFAAETEPDKLQEMINTDLAAIERWYDANGMEPLKQWLRATYKLRNKSSIAIIQRYQLVKTSISLVSPLTTSSTSINRSPMWQERYPNSLLHWNVWETFYLLIWGKEFNHHLLPPTLTTVLTCGISAAKPHPIN